LRGATLYYYKDKSNDNCLGDIRLEQAVVRQAVDDSKQFVFEIVTKTRAYVLAAESAKEMQSWIAHLALQTKLHVENAQIETAEQLLATAMSYFRRDFLAGLDVAVEQHTPSNKTSPIAKTNNATTTTTTTTTAAAAAEATNNGVNKRQDNDAGNIAEHNDDDEDDDDNNNNNKNVDDKMKKSTSIQAILQNDDNDDETSNSDREDDDRLAVGGGANVEQTSKPEMTSHDDGPPLGAVSDAPLNEAAPSVATRKAWAVEAIQAGNFGVGQKLLCEALAENPKDAVALYNLACVESLLQNKRQSFDYLELALKNGYNNLDKLLHDPDLNNLRTLERFWPMVKEYQSNLHLFDLMRQPNTGVPVQTRKWMLKSYPNCFIGSEAVAWLGNDMSVQKYVSY
jgi:hypothetical protein